jgi:hypothetical protein
MLNQERILEFQEGNAILSIPKYSSMGHVKWYELVRPIKEAVGRTLETRHTWKYLYVLGDHPELHRDDSLSDIPGRKNKKIYTIEDFYKADGESVGSNYQIF